MARPGSIEINLQRHAGCSPVLTPDPEVVGRYAYRSNDTETVPLYRTQALQPEVISRQAAEGFRLLALENLQFVNRAPAGSDDLVDQ